MGNPASKAIDDYIHSIFLDSGVNAQMADMVKVIEKMIADHKAQIIQMTNQLAAQHGQSMDAVHQKLDAIHQTASQPNPQVVTALTAIGAAHDQANAQHVQHHKEAMGALTAEKELVRGKDGKAAGVRIKKANS